jgi:hypothetical protein
MQAVDIVDDIFSLAKFGPWIWTMKFGFKLP